MKAKRVILILTIAILVAFFVGYGLEVFYPRPEYEDFCKTAGKFPSSPERIGGDLDEHGCNIAAGYSWCESKNKCLRTWEENCPGSCEEKYENARETYDRNVFFILGIIGLAVILFGIKGPRLEDYISAGLMGGGVLTLIYGIMGYWGHFSDQIRFVFIGIVLLLLILIGNKYKKYFK